MLRTVQFYESNHREQSSSPWGKRFFRSKNDKQVFWKEIALRKRPLRRSCPGPLGLQSLTFGAKPGAFCVPWQLFIYLKVLCLYWTTAHSTHASLTSVFFFPSSHKRTHFLSHPPLKFIKHHAPGWKAASHCCMGKLRRLCFPFVFLFQCSLIHTINTRLIHLKHIVDRFVIWSAKSLPRKHFDRSDRKCAFSQETTALLAEMCRWGGSTSFKQAPGRCWSRRRSGRRKREEDPPNRRDRIWGITCQFCPWWPPNPAGQPFLPGENPRSRWPASPCLLVILMWSDI